MNSQMYIFFTNKTHCVVKAIGTRWPRPKEIKVMGSNNKGADKTKNIFMQDNAYILVKQMVEICIEMVLKLGLLVDKII